MGMGKWKCVRKCPDLKELCDRYIYPAKIQGSSSLWANKDVAWNSKNTQSRRGLYTNKKRKRKEERNHINNFQSGKFIFMNTNEHLIMKGSNILLKGKNARWNKKVRLE